MSEETKIVLTDEEANELFNTLFCGATITYDAECYANGQQGAYRFEVNLSQKSLGVLKKMQRALTNREQCPLVSCLGEFALFRDSESDDPFDDMYRQCDTCGAGFEKIY